MFFGKRTLFWKKNFFEKIFIFEKKFFLPLEPKSLGTKRSAPKRPRLKVVDRTI